jgi:hypothetical protein
MAGIGTHTAAIALFFIDMNNLPNHSVFLLPSGALYQEAAGKSVSRDTVPEKSAVQWKGKQGKETFHGLRST